MHGVRQVGGIRVGSYAFSPSGEGISKRVDIINHYQC